MITRIIPQLFKHLFSRVFTNPFPTAHMPPSLTDFLSSHGEPPNPPVPVGNRFRGWIDYDRDKCIGCRLCVRVCPTRAAEYQEESKKIVIHKDRCCFCAQCTEICPVKCLAMSNEYMISSYNRRENVVTDPGQP